MSLNRRSLKSRGTAWAKLFSQTIARAGITPNQVSTASVFFALLSMFCFYYSTKNFFLIRGGCLFFAALFIQLRLLCNLMDGMLAIELKMKTAVGDLFNEVPDRIADVFILVGLGLAASGTYKTELS